MCLCMCVSSVCVCMCVCLVCVRSLLINVHISLFVRMCRLATHFTSLSSLHHTLSTYHTGLLLHSIPYPPPTHSTNTNRNSSSIVSASVSLLLRHHLQAFPHSHTNSHSSHLPQHERKRPRGVWEEPAGVTGEHGSDDEEQNQLNTNSTGSVSSLHHNDHP